MIQGQDTDMTTGGKDDGDAGSNASENKGGSGGTGGGFPVCRLCQHRHRLEVRCWEPCSRCDVRHHKRSARPTGSALNLIEDRTIENLSMILDFVPDETVLD